MGVNEDDVAFSGVAAQAEFVRRGDISSRELVELSLSRIERFDPELNAFTAVHAERALANADAADARRRQGDRAALLGVPVAVKDEIDMAGEITGYGTRSMRTPATDDAEVVQRLRAAGAVVVGRTTMPEFGLWPFTESLHWGVTRNPWDTGRTPGGSSGGSAAAVAAGLVPAALAADGAGSIRIPAACCGIFGLKPQNGRVPRAPHDRESARWISFGSLTRSVGDSALVLDAIRGPMLRDSVTIDQSPSAFLASTESEPPRLRIGVSADLPPGTPGSLSSEVGDALQQTAEVLVSAGHRVVECDLGLRHHDTLVIASLLFRGIRDSVKRAERPERLERRTRSMARPGALVPDAVRDGLRIMEHRLGTRVRRLFEDVDVVLSPTISRPPVQAQLMEGRGAVITYLWATTWVPFNVLWNSTGQPAASVPAGFTVDGLPLAVQIVGRPHAETTLLSLAAQLEAATPWWKRRPPGYTGEPTAFEPP